jgi:hypothetical protein
MHPTVAASVLLRQSAARDKLCQLTGKINESGLDRLILQLVMQADLSTNSFCNSFSATDTAPVRSASQRVMMKMLSSINSVQHL